ncbi:hypothetical protein AB0L41_43380 [Amycolatopsis mediterranei]|uniref:hypothetical protein n=1 Tax=Amycolatopsis mediterranei TaxID=33910 RepID=UPI0034478D3F
MVDQRNPLYTSAFWEFKNSTGGVNRATASLAHGWAASPSVQLNEQLLGVKPVDAGYRTWSIAPNPRRMGTLRAEAAPAGSSAPLSDGQDNEMRPRSGRSAEEVPTPTL